MKSKEFDLTNPELLTKEYILETQKPNLLNMIVSVAFILLCIFIVLPLLFNSNGVHFIMILIILTPFFLSGIIMGYVVLKELGKISAIKNNDYYIEEGLIENKYEYGYQYIKTYEIKCKDLKNKIITTQDQYFCSEIGDIIYIFTFGNYKFGYNKKFFKLEDESKIRKRVDN